MTLDERVAKLEERSERILESLQRVQGRLDSMDERLDKLVANHSFLRGRVGINAKASAGLATSILAVWEVVKRVLGV